MDKRIFFKYPKLLNFYPPYIGAGIRLKDLNESKNRFHIEMKLKWYNRNVYGTHFGGSLYAMCDPFFVFIIYHYFGEDYIIWDKKASINFKRPGRGTVHAIFEIPLKKLEEIKHEVDQEETRNFDFSSEVLDANNEIVALVSKTVYIRKK